MGSAFRSVASDETRPRSTLGTSRVTVGVTCLIGVLSLEEEQAAREAASRLKMTARMAFTTEVPCWSPRFAPTIPHLAGFERCKCTGLIILMKVGTVRLQRFRAGDGGLSTAAVRFST